MLARRSVAKAGADVRMPAHTERYIRAGANVRIANVRIGGEGVDVKIRRCGNEKIKKQSDICQRFGIEFLKPQTFKPQTPELLKNCMT